MPRDPRSCCSLLPAPEQRRLDRAAGAPVVEPRNSDRKWAAAAGDCSRKAAAGIAAAGIAAAGIVAAGIAAAGIVAAEIAAAESAAAEIAAAEIAVGKIAAGPARTAVAQVAAEAQNEAIPLSRDPAPRLRWERLSVIDSAAAAVHRSDAVRKAARGSG